MSTRITWATVFAGVLGLLCSMTAPVEAQCLTCPGDVDGNAVVNLSDVSGFVTCLLTGANCACADMNNDSFRDGRDIRGFVQTLLAGSSGLLIRAGLDCWKSSECTSDDSRYSFCDNPIPAGFFGPGSLPFSGKLSLGTGNPNGFDTNVRRMSDMAFCGIPSTRMTALTIESLNLVGCQPITVSTAGGDELWDVRVDLSQPRTLNFITDIPFADCPGASLTNTRTVGPPNCPQVYRLRVPVNVIHSRIGDVSVTLTHVESGTTVTLMDRIGFPAPPACSACTAGGNANPNVNVIFDDDAALDIQTQTGNVSNGLAYRPAQPLAAFSGVQGCGTWRITVTDCATSFQGHLFIWGLIFDAPPPPPQGTMSVTRTYAPTPDNPDVNNGGTFTSSFKVPARFTFTRQGDGAVRVLDPGVVGIPLIDLSVPASDPAPWIDSLIIPIPNEYCDPGNGFPRNFFPALEQQQNPPPGEPDVCCVAVGHAGPGHLHKTGVRCGVQYCEGACCLPTGECVILKRPDCDAATGVFKGDKTTCADNDGDGVPDVNEDRAYNPTCGCQTSADLCKTQTDPADDNTDDDGACDGCEAYVLLTNACNPADALPGGPNCPDCNGNGVCDPCEILGNYPAFVQGKPPTGCQLSPDCNNNLIPDDCEPDQDGDGVPDDCDPCTDVDGDGYGVDVGNGINCPNGNTPDCDDNDPAINPGAVESLGQGNCDDGLDNDCDNLTDAADPDCAAGAILINEVRIDQPGIDIDEYFELVGAPGASLNDLTYIVIGDGTVASGVIEVVVSLAGQVIPPDGHFLVAEDNNTLGAVADFIPGPAVLNFENNDNMTHMLVTGFSGALNQDLDTDDDCVLDIQPWTAVVDLVALIVENNPPTITECHYGTGPNDIVGPDGSFVPGHVLRFPDGANWCIGPFDPVGGKDTPGVTNAVTCP